jgi:cytochrome c-type biogenesis protein CcmH
MKHTRPTQIESLKRHLAELDRLIADGVLTGDASRQARDALERDVVAAVLAGSAPSPTLDASAATAPAAASARPSRRLWVGVAGSVLAIASVGYAWTGGYDRFVASRALDAPAASAGNDDHARDDQIDAMLARLAARLRSQPDDAQGWAMLARSYAARNRIDEAVPALRKVVELRPDDAQALADYADGLASSLNGKLAGEPELLVTRALALDPHNVKALALAGTIAFDRGDFAGAIARWEQALAGVDPATDFARQVQEALSEARERAGLPSVALGASSARGSSAQDEAQAAVGAITGRVSLAAPLRSAVAADDTVFIYARSASGSKMPLAILRKRVADLPLAFTLDDSSAMSAGARLSSAGDVVVSARVSKSGSATPQPGDLQATNASVRVGTRDLQLEIAETVR